MSSETSTNDVTAVEPGWSVKTDDDHKAGTIKEVTDRYFLVSSGTFGGQELYLPLATLEHVRPEFKEIGISLTQAEFEEGDWSQPPTEGPRTSGAPLNESGTIDVVPAGVDESAPRSDRDTRLTD